MLVIEKLGNINSFETGKRSIDYLPLEWHESNKRILHKRTVSGTEVVMKFMQRNQQLTDGDVIWEDDKRIIVINIIPCDAIVIQPKTLFNMACICYEIGNKHLPLFYHENELLVEYEDPLFHQLVNMGFEPVKDKRKLLQSLKTSVLPHITLGDGILSVAKNPST